MDKAVKKLIKEAQRQGWTTKETKKGVMLLAPNGKGSVMVHKTNSDVRGLKNAVSEMKKRGFQP